jgi:hypothetical protein
MKNYFIQFWVCYVVGFIFFGVALLCREVVIFGSMDAIMFDLWLLCADVAPALTCLHHTCISRQLAAFHHTITKNALHRRARRNSSPVSYDDYSVAYQKNDIPVTS